MIGKEKKWGSIRSISRLHKHGKFTTARRRLKNPRNFEIFIFSSLLTDPKRVKPNNESIHSIIPCIKIIGQALY